MEVENFFIIFLLMLNFFSPTINNQSNLGLTDDLPSKDQLPNYAISSFDNFLSDNSTWMDYPEDSDNDGLYDSITVNLNKPKYLSQSFSIYALLKNQSGTWFGFTSNHVYSYTTDDIILSFSGFPINTGKSDNYLDLWLEIVNYSPTYNFSFVYTTTNMYNHSDFEVSPGMINDFSDYGFDTNGDSLFDEIILNTSVTVTKTDHYSVGAYLITNTPFDVLSGSLGGNWDGYLDPGTHTVELSIPTSYFYTNKLNGPYTIGFAYLNSDSESLLQFLTDFKNTSYYSYKDFNQPSAYFTGNYWDTGVDTNENGKFELLKIDAELNITMSDNYQLSLSLKPLFGTMEDLSTTSSTYLTTGVHNISATFNMNKIFSERTNTSYKISYITVYNSQSEIQSQVVEPYITRIYNYTEFEPPKAFFTGTFWDYGVDSDGDNKYNLLNFDLEINITQAGTYQIYMDSKTNSSDDYYYGNVNSYFNSGIHNVSIELAVKNYYALKLNTSYVIQTVDICDSNYVLIDRLNPDYETRVYNYLEFDAPSAFLLRNYWYRGIDTDNNGKFDQLVFDIEINVTESDNYDLEILFFTNTTGKQHTNSFSGYWNIGIQNISIATTIESYYSQQLNSSFILSQVEIYDSANNKLDSVTPQYATKTYDYNEFDAPSVYLTGKHWDDGIDLTDDGRFNKLIFDYEINVTENGSYFLDLYVRAENSGSYQMFSGGGDFTQGIHNISVLVTVRSYYSEHLNTSYVLYSLTLRNSTYTIESFYSDYVTRTYNFSEFNPPNFYLTGNYLDNGVDTNGDGRFDKIYISVEINVTQSGDYYLLIRLKDTNYNSYSSSVSGIWNVGIVNVTVSFDAKSFFSSRNNQSFIIYYAELRFSNSTIIESPSMYELTRLYNYTEFDRPSVFFTENYYSNVLDTDGDGFYNQIRFDIEINVTQSGNYHFYIRIRNGFASGSYYKYLDGSWNVGLYNLSMTIESNSIYYYRSNNSFIIDYMYSRDNFYYTIIDELYPNFQTRIYNYSEFDPPGMYFTENYFNYGKDTDGDGRFNQLAIGLEVNVSIADTYTIQVYLENVETGNTFSSSINKFFYFGLQNVTLSFDVIVINLDRFTTAYVIYNVIIRNSSSSIIDRLYPYISTRIYNYNEFDPPNAYVTGNYFIDGSDTDSDGRFNELAIIIEVNVTKSDYYQLDIVLRSSKTGTYYYGTAYGTWTEGLQNISVSIDASSLYITRDNTSYELIDVSLNNGSFVLDRQKPYIESRLFNYTEFDPPVIYFTGNFYDTTIDTDNDGTANQLVIYVEVNITLAGFYYLDYQIRANTNAYYYHDSVSGNWAVGLTNISIAFDAISNSFFLKKINTTYSINYVYLRISSSYTIDHLNPLYTTRTYNYSEFEPPGAYFTENYFSRGIDTDGDGQFNKIEFIVEVNITESGNYNLNMDVSSSISYPYYYLSCTGFWIIGLTNISFSIDASSFYGKRINNSYQIRMVDLYYGNNSYIHRIYPYFMTRQYNYTEFDPPKAYIVGKYTDNGIDSTGDGKFDKLQIIVEINVTEAGFYRLELTLRNSISGTSYYGTASGTWAEGVLNATFFINAESFYINRINTTFTIYYLRLYNESNYIIDYLYPYSPTRVYNYTEFDPPKAYLIGKYTDNGIDSNGDGQFDKLQINVEINVTEAGFYRLELTLRNSISGTSYYGTASGTWAEGVLNATVFIDARSFYINRINTTFTIYYLRLYNESNYLLDKYYPDVSTRVYNYTEFDTPDVFFTGIFYDKGLDTNDDSKFDEFMLDLEVNVTLTGTYTFYLQLYTFPGYSYYNSKSNYLLTGIHNVTFIIDASSFYKTHTNSSFRIYNIYIRNASNYKIDDYYPNYYTRIYNYSEFDFPSVYFIGKYYDYGLDTDDDGSFNELIFIIGVNVQKADNYTLSITIQSNYGIYDSKEVQVYLNNGVQNISVSFETGQFYLSGHNQYIAIGSLTLRNSTYYILDKISQPYQTRIYAFSEFDEVDAPIRIYGNYDFQYTAASRNWAGNGTVESPYIIENLILFGSSYLIDIESTDVYFEIKNVTLNSGMYGIYLNRIKHGVVTENVIFNNYNGIRIYNSDDIVISSNNISNNDYSSISIIFSNNIIISKNTLTNNRYGLDILNSQFLNIKENIIQSSTANSPNSNVEYGINMITATDHIIQENIISNYQTGIVISNSDDNSIFKNELYNNLHEAIGLHSGRSNSIYENIVSNNGAGIVLYESSYQNSIYNNTVYSNTAEGISLHQNNNNNIVMNNKIFTNGIGLVLDRSSGNKLNSNQIHDNFGFGISLSGNENAIEQNTIIRNDGGIQLTGSFSQSTNNVIYFNNIHDNNQNGLIVEFAQNNKFSLNLIYSNEQCGIYATNESSSNLFQNNDFRDNYGCVTQVIDNGSLNKFSGNYYSNRNGENQYVIQGIAGNSDFTPASNPNHITGILNLLPAKIIGNQVTLQWINSGDLFGHSLRYDIFYSVDNGNTWITIDTNLTQTLYHWLVPDLENGTAVLIKINTNDDIGFQSVFISNEKYYQQLISSPGTYTLSNTPNLTNLLTDGITIFIALLFGGGIGSLFAIIRKQRKTKK